MIDDLIEQIRTHISIHAPRNIHPPASQFDIEKAEERLGFSIPQLLKLCYLGIGNGGFGPGYGIIGVKGGYESDYGDLVETHDILKRGQEADGRKTHFGLLPFCEWGCNIFSCVACHDAQQSVYTLKELVPKRQSYNLREFFQLWLSGADILRYRQRLRSRTSEFRNPFTGKNAVLPVEDDTDDSEK